MFTLPCASFREIVASRYLQPPSTLFSFPAGPENNVVCFDSAVGKLICVQKPSLWVIMHSLYHPEQYNCQTVPISRIPLNMKTTREMYTIPSYHMYVFAIYLVDLFAEVFPDVRIAKGS